MRQHAKAPFELPAKFAAVITWTLQFPLRISVYVYVCVGNIKTQLKVQFELTKQSESQSVGKETHQQWERQLWQLPFPSHTPISVSSVSVSVSAVEYLRATQTSAINYKVAILFFCFIFVGFFIYLLFFFVFAFLFVCKIILIYFLPSPPTHSPRSQR